MALSIAAGMIGGAIIGGAMNYFSAKDRQSQQEDYTDKTSGQQYQWNKEAATTAWERSKEASTTAYARDVDFFKNRYIYSADGMRKAGLNPILAASGGFSSSTPKSSMAQAPMSSVGLPSTPNVAPANFTSSAKDVASAWKSKSDIDKQRKEIALLDNKMDESLSMAIKNRANAKLYSKQEDAIATDILKGKANIKLMAKQEDMTDAQKDMLLNQAEQLYHRLVQLRKVASVYKTPTGTGLIWLQEFLKTLGIPMSAIVGFGVGRKLNVPSPRKAIEGKGSKWKPIY